MRLSGTIVVEEAVEVAESSQAPLSLWRLYAL